MPKVKRQRIAHTEEWSILQQRTLWPEQQHYELIRPIVLFGDTSAERAEQTGTAERTLYRRADRFDQEGRNDELVCWWADFQVRKRTKRSCSNASSHG